MLQCCADIFAGLLLPTDVAGRSAAAPAHKFGRTGPQHLHVKADMEAGHLFLQRQTFVSSHHHHTQQAGPTVPGRQDPLLFTVTHLRGHVTVLSSHLGHRRQGLRPNFWHDEDG